MIKVFGKRDEFALVKEEGTRMTIGYDLQEISGSDNATWYEIYFPLKKGKPSFEQVKQAIINDIDEHTTAAILTGYQWIVLHGEDLGTVANVWLSKENQMNYKAKHDSAKEYPQLVSWPIKYKIGEHPDKTPIYEEFANIGELAQFYLGGIAYIEQCYNEGWAKKDSIDWSIYKPYFPDSEIPVEE